MDAGKTDTAMAERIARLAAERGGRAYYVGGCVRDSLLGRGCKDTDIELHGLTPREAEALLDGLGQRMTIGESFGIYGLKGCALDIALPRREEQRGVGHRDFDVCVDPFIGTKAAARRRDFTMNALLRDVLTGELVDFFGGAADLKAGLVRHVDDRSFPEDPLRVLRAAQFAARFGFTVAEETVALCRGMRLDALPRERIEGELKKALLLAPRPSVFFETLRAMEQLHDWFPEAEALLGLEQDPRHHSEGDVWAHTMLVLDEGAGYRERVRDPFGFMLACLTHDFGKALCTRRIDGEIHAYGHERLGLPLAERFLARLTGERQLTRYVLDLTEHHMLPNMLAADNASVKATNKMFDRCGDPLGLLCLAFADGRGKRAPRPCVSHDAFLYERLAVYEEYMSRPYVAGRDLVEAGLTPGAQFSRLLEFAHKLRLAGVDKDSALKQTLSYARGLSPDPCVFFVDKGEK